MIDVRERSRRFVLVPQKPEQPPEGRLLEEALAARRPHMTQRQAAALAGISDARWRQLVTGYQSVGQGNYAPLTARAETLARMAAAVGVTPEQLTAVDREDAAAVLLRLQRERNEAAHQVGSGTLPVGSGVQPLDLSELSPEDQEYVLGLVERLRRQRGE